MVGNQISDLGKPGSFDQVNPSKVDFRNFRPWGIGMMECWNNGIVGRGSIFISMAQIRRQNQDPIRF